MAASLREIDEGWDFKVLVLDEEWVLRIPRTARTAEKLAMEVALVRALAPALPVEVPRFAHVSHEPPFVVYRLIPGEPLRNEDPESVRAFLEALHSFDATALDVPRPDWRGVYRDHADEWRRVVFPLLDADERPRGEARLAEIESLEGFEPVLAHCDLGPEHLICEDGRLAGVIDWGDAKIGDPAIDYAFVLNGPFPDWDVDDELRRRAGIYHRLASWFGVGYGLRTEQPQWVRNSLAEIRSTL